MSSPYVANYYGVEYYIAQRTQVIPPLLPSRLEHMPPRLSHSAALILKALSLGYRFGFDIMEVTGLPSGTVYPALRRLERDALVASQWEPEADATASGRPARRYY